jgi:hypothetical protein
MRCVHRLQWPVAFLVYACRHDGIGSSSKYLLVASQQMLLLLVLCMHACMRQFDRLASRPPASLASLSACPLELALHCIWSSLVTSRVFRATQKFESKLFFYTSHLDTAVAAVLS